MDFGTLEGLTLKEINEDFYRNIVSLRVSQDLFDDLSDSPDDWAVATALELRFKPWNAEGAPIVHRPFEEAEYNNLFFYEDRDEITGEAIKYPFLNWTETRFSRGRFGVWYGSFDLETTIHETVYHWKNSLLQDAGLLNREGLSIERRVHLVHCEGALINLVPKKGRWPQLVSNDYNHCQNLGERLHKEGHPGLLAPSARCEGVNAVIFTSAILSNPRPNCYLTYKLSGDSVLVSREPDRVMCIVS